MYKALSIPLLFTLCLFSCVKSIIVPNEFNYKEVSANSYTLAVWQKMPDEKSPVHIYIEGDGHSFNSYGYPTNDPTPKGTFLREIAFNDPNKNVVYIARPGQFIKSDNQTDWTTGRFSKQIVEAFSQIITEISSIGDRKIVLIGYSGGALLSGLVINQNPNLKIEKWITIAGVLNHAKWTKQVHLAGEKDRVIPLELTKSIVPKETLIIVPKATHNSGFEDCYNIIYCIDGTK